MNAVDAELPPEYTPDWAGLGAPTDEHPFMQASVELLKEAGGVCLLMSGVVPDSSHQRDAAICCGLLVRLGKLCRLMLADTCEVGGGQQLALSRQVIDTAASLLFLAEDRDGSRHQAFVENSLVAEREMARDIARRQRVDGGEAWPIEERMLGSIERTALAAGVGDVSALPSRSKIRWAKSEELVKRLGPAAYTAYRAGSGQIHGNWHDLLRNHLEQVAGGFQPNFSPGTPRPQPLLTVALVAVIAARAYLTLRPGIERAYFEERLNSLEARLAKVDELHERFLQA